MFKIVLKTAFVLMIALASLTVSAIAQDKFDVVTFSAPRGWQKEASPKGDSVRFTKDDAASNVFAMITIFKAIPAGADAKANFDAAWDSLAKQTLNAGVPQMNAVKDENGWEIQSGLAEFQKEGLSGVALLTTASAENKMVNVLLVTNTDIYQKEIENFFDSVKLPLIAKSSNGITTSTNSGSVRDYEFVVPPTWTRQDLANEIVLRKGAGNSQYVISLQPFTASGGDLENDAERIFWQVFEGWQPSPTASYVAYEKGKTKQGLNYFLVKKFLNKRQNNSNLQMDGMLLLVQVGNRVAVISGSQPYNDIARSTLEALDQILFDLGIKGIGVANFQKELHGTWSSANSSVGFITTYHPNNTFSSGGATQTRMAKDDRTDIVTTRGYAADGSYSLNGNVLTKNFTKTKVTHRSKIRFYYTKNDNENWVFKMGNQGITVNGISVFTKE